MHDFIAKYHHVSESPSKVVSPVTAREGPQRSSYAVDGHQAGPHPRDAVLRHLRAGPSEIRLVYEVLDELDNKTDSKERM